MKLKYVACLVLLVTAFGCAQAPKPAAAPAPTAAQSSRELAPLDHHVINRATLHAEVEAVGEPLIADDTGAQHVIIPVGTGQPIHCFVYPKPINLAQSLRMLINGVLTQVQQQATTHIVAGQIEGAPYLQATTHYRMDKEGVSVEGEVKYLASRNDNSATMCMHDEVGYEATFLRIVSGFIASQELPDAPVDQGRRYLVWHAVSLESTQDNAVGVIESRLYEGEGGYAFATAKSVLRPDADGSLHANDEAEHQYSNLDGVIIAAKYVKITDDAVSYNLELNQTNAHTYIVKGISSGATVQTTLQVGQALPDFVSRTAELRRLYADKKTQRTLRWEIFSPEQPTQTQSMQFTKKATARDGLVTIGRETRHVVIDEHGMQVSTITDRASVQRLWQAGQS